MSFYLPAEWEEQDAVQIIWPCKDSDWAENLEEAIICFTAIGKAICKDQKLILIHKANLNPSVYFSAEENENIHYITADYNDTWSRDIAPISIKKDGKSILCDFQFNGWGNKFDHSKDNLLNQQLNIFHHLIRKDFILEGGSIESNGAGILLTTEDCLLNKNRNINNSKKSIETRLKKDFNLKEILWLKNGSIKGDDTDSHIDTLARFCSENTIIYTQCKNPKDVHYESLKKMEKELENFSSFNLIPIPLPTAIYNGNLRKPATYANFLITNKSVLIPLYNVPTDREAIRIIKLVFPNRKIIGIDCTPLIQQNGSLHCVTMQYVKDSLDLSLLNA